MRSQKKINKLYAGKQSYGLLMTCKKKLHEGRQWKSKFQNQPILKHKGKKKKSIFNQINAKRIILSDLHYKSYKKKFFTMKDSENKQNRYKEQVIHMRIFCLFVLIFMKRMDCIKQN